MSQAEVQGRLAEVEFSIEYADGMQAQLPVDVKAAQVKIGDAVVESFRTNRGEIRNTGPGRYGVSLNPALYTVATWFRIEWFISHPTKGLETMVPVEYFFRAVEDVPDDVSNLYPGMMISEPGSVLEERHLIAREIIRREALLLRRYNGSFCAFLLRRQSGDRCPECWDFTAKRKSRGNCRRCYDVGFFGGYAKPIYGFVFHWDPARTVRLTQMGENKEQRGTDDWTTSYPVLNAGDVFALQDGTRWRIMDPRSTKLQGEGGAHLVRQVFEVSRLDPTDVVMQFPVPDLRRPVDTFVGFMAGQTRRSDVGGVTFRASGLL